MLEVALGIIAVPFVLTAIYFAFLLLLAGVVMAAAFIPTIAVTAIMLASDLQITNYTLFITVLLITGAINALLVFWPTAHGPKTTVSK